MYTLSLDEFGKFEEIDNKPKGIAGVIYDDGDFEFEPNNEVKRIRAFYKQIIEMAKVKLGDYGEDLSYPRGLHHNNKVSPEIQKMHEQAVKKLVSKHLPEFMREGTVEGKKVKDANGGVFPERKGRYFIYCILKSDTGKTVRLEDASKKLQNDNEGFNLYFHMSDEVVGRTVFHNPVVPAKSDFSLNLATRISPKYLRNKETFKQFDNYEAKSKYVNGKDVVMEDGKGGVYYNIGSLDVYRTIIGKYLAEDNPNNINIKELRVESINYNNISKDKPYEFLYLADSICSVISFKLCNDIINDSLSWIKEVNRRCLNILPKERLLIFGYDDIDIAFSDALNQFQNGKYYDALKICHDSKNNTGCFADYYEANWFPYIKKMIVESKDVELVEKAIHELYMSQLSNKYEQDRGIYILNVLEKAIDTLIKKNNAHGGKAIAELYQCGVITYCHIGDYKKAERYRKKAEEFVEYINIEAYLRMKHILCVCYTDGFEWNKALKYADDILENEKSLVLTKLKITGNEILSYSGVAKANSTKGQIYSYCRDDHAEDYFDIALKYFEKGSPNYLITLSYLLQHYIDMGEKTKYSGRSLEYFGGKSNFEERLDYIIEEGLKDRPIFNLKFALFVFVKGIYVFDKDKIGSRLSKRLSDIEGYVNRRFKELLPKDTIWKLSGHPAELIYKYIALLSIDRGEPQEETDIIINKLNGCLENKELLLECIRLLSLAEIEDLKGDRELRNELIKSIAEKLKNGVYVFRKIDPNEKSDKLFEIMKHYFSYMYC